MKFRLNNDINREPIKKEIPQEVIKKHYFDILGDEKPKKGASREKRNTA